MAGNPILSEADVTVENLVRLFRDASFEVEVDDQGDIVVTTDDDVTTVVSIEQPRKLVYFFALFDVGERTPREELSDLVLQLNSEVILARFAIAEERLLVADYYLPFAEGLLTAQLLHTVRLFSRVVAGSIQEDDDDDEDDEDVSGDGGFPGI